MVICPLGAKSDSFTHPADTEQESHLMILSPIMSPSYLLVFFFCLFGDGQVAYRGIFKLFLLLPAVSGNNTDESSETELKQLKCREPNQNNENYVELSETAELC